MKRNPFKLVPINKPFFFKEKCLIHSDIKPLRRFNTNSAGRNNHGKITIRHRGGGHKKLYRIIDYKRNNLSILGQVKKFVYDPNRNVKLALIYFRDGEKRYILYPQNLIKNNFILSGHPSITRLTPGNSLQLQYIPLGFHIHNISLYLKKGGQLVRAAGTCAKILGKKENYIILRLPSSEIRLVHKCSHATIGILSKPVVSKKNKAGQNRWLGIRPTVRGIAMNACDHPHGGGEGRSPIGRKTPLTPWGKIALGKKTRNVTQASTKLILKRKIV